MGIIDEREEIFVGRWHLHPTNLYKRLDSLAFVSNLQQATARLNFGEVLDISLEQLEPCSQSLRTADEEISQLKDSVEIHGLLNPLLVRPKGRNRFEVICGHRRFSALRQLGAVNAPCRILKVDEKDAFEISLVENLERRSLDPIEEAMAFRHYISTRKWGRCSSLARKIGRSEEYVSQRLRLLSLPGDILSKVGKEISPSHAEEITWLEDEKSMRKLALVTIENKLTVRQLHELAKREKNSKNIKGIRSEVGIPPMATMLKDDLDGKIFNNAAYLPKAADENRILNLSIVSLRYFLAYLDSCIDTISSKENCEKSFSDFLMNARFEIHQILDHFISAKVKRGRSKSKFYWLN